jgi:uncharacterized lipoprotein YddW (UPF0748 family)
LFRRGILYGNAVPLPLHDLTGDLERDTSAGMSRGALQADERRLGGRALGARRVSICVGAALVVALAVLRGVGVQAGARQDPVRPVELRGVWMTNVDSAVLDSRASIAEAMDFLAAHHFNVVFPVVWNKTYTLYPSRVMRRAFGTEIDPKHRGRDPLAELIEEAHRRRIAVVPWFEYGFAASYRAGGGRLIDAHPSWAARDRDGQLLTKNGFEWLDPLNAEVERFLTSLVLEVVARYRVQGVQGDDRLPAMPVEGGYSDAARALYAREHGGAPPPIDFRDGPWVRWRAGKLSAIAQRIHRAVKRRKPGLVVSWAPSVFPFALDEYLQDWPAWVNGGYADIVHPQVYRRTIDDYRRTLDAQGAAALGLARQVVYPGVLINVGRYVVADDLLVQMVAANRERGYRGEVFFFYEGLRKDGNRLARALLRSHYAAPADLPFRAGL